MALALYQPDIALNTGTLLRLGACLDVPVHVIHPTGFPFSRTTLKRSGLDYLDHVQLIEHDSFARFDAWRRNENRRLALLSTKAETSVYETRFSPGDILMMGRESAGVPAPVAECADLRLRIPMRQSMRSLNVAISASIVLGEALRQTNYFTSLS
ncbi:tRNA (cytidine(34)-2'-O)-methyltransferase [Pelagibacterium halotolerans]